MGRGKLAWLFMGFALAASTGGCSDTPTLCSPCRPGTRASNPSVHCSACIPIDGGADASDGAAGSGGVAGVAGTGGGAGLGGSAGTSASRGGSTGAGNTAGTGGTSGTAGGCGTCAANYQCVNDVCKPTCPMLVTCTSAEVCVLGFCEPRCAAGETPCADGICIPLNGGDPLHCGGCNPCPVGAACVSGVCH